MTRDEIIDGSRAEGGMLIVIPSVVKLDAALPLSAQMLYGIITWKCNRHAYTWATNRELGKALGVSGKRVSALLALLERQGHIETEICYRDGTNEILRRYIYPVMKSTRPLMKERPLPENEDTPPSVQGGPAPEPGTAPPENGEIICNIKKQKGSIKDTPCSPPSGDAPIPEPVQEDKRKRPRREKSAPVHAPEAFEAFWAAYPRKDDRKAAIRAWDRLKADRELCRTMYAALNRQRGSEQWAEAGGKYIPLFSTWLNGRKWENQGVDLSLLSRPQDAGGWMADPEVTR